MTAVPFRDLTPLCVDLDGTLCRSDTLREAVRALLLRAPFTALLLPFWLLGGRARFKRLVARRAALCAERLPYNDALLDHLRWERRRGRPVWLVTAADRSIAEAVAAHLGLFDGVLASDGGGNLKGRRKLVELQRRFPRGFDYAGNSSADLPLWRAARRAIVVNASHRLLRKACSQARVALVVA
jgi:phosphoserine phosphatase